MKKEREKKKVGVGRESGDVGGKGGIRGKLKKFFFFLGVTYSCIFKKRGYRSPFKKIYMAGPVAAF